MAIVTLAMVVLMVMAMVVVTVMTIVAVTVVALVMVVIVDGEGKIKEHEDDDKEMDVVLERGGLQGCTASNGALVEELRATPVMITVTRSLVLAGHEGVPVAGEVGNAEASRGKEIPHEMGKGTE